MRAVVGIVSLVVVLAAVGLLVKKQLAASRVVAPSVSSPSVAGDAAPLAADPKAHVKVQSQQIQQQYKQALDAAMQQARPADDADKP